MRKKESEHATHIRVVFRSRTQCAPGMMIMMIWQSFETLALSPKRTEPFSSGNIEEVTFRAGRVQYNGWCSTFLTVCRQCSATKNDTSVLEHVRHTCVHLLPTPSRATSARILVGSNISTTLRSHTMTWSSVSYTSPKLWPRGMGCVMLVISAFASRICLAKYGGAYHALHMNETKSSRLQQCAVCCVRWLAFIKITTGSIRTGFQLSDNGRAAI